MPARKKSSSPKEGTAHHGFLRGIPSGQEKRACGALFGRAKRARRVRLRRKLPNQSNPSTRRLSIMKLALRGTEADFGKEHPDTLRDVQHSDKRFDYVLANPPFNEWNIALGACPLTESNAKLQIVSAGKGNMVGVTCLNAYGNN